MGVKRYPLEVEEELWTAFKDTVPRSQYVDEPLLRFVIERVIDEFGRDRVPDVYLEWYDGDLDTRPRPWNADADAGE